MKRKTAKLLGAVFDDVESMHPKKSFEWLLQMTADTARQRHGLDVEPADIVTALGIISDENGGKVEL